MPVDLADFAADRRFQMPGFKRFTITFEQIFHFDALHPCERFGLQNRVQRPLAGIPIHQFAPDAIELAVIRFTQVSLFPLLCQRRCLDLQILFQLFALEVSSWFCSALP
ncbi:hypothetical protein SAMN05216404_10993 [Nitrosospira multiformis]|uniref:Uncharacterized protein n=1 Tax=Nitrosospira multiformis TaxID=1231 RepID=A0A1H8KX04_9PROT|nr:hypothetical protein SAMN05216404_10993 [Nitrosospira multiformis]